MLEKQGDGSNSADGDSHKPGAVGSHLRLISVQKLWLLALKIWKILHKNLDLQLLLHTLSNRNGQCIGKICGTYYFLPQQDSSVTKIITIAQDCLL